MVVGHTYIPHTSAAKPTRARIVVSLVPYAFLKVRHHEPQVAILHIPVSLVATASASEVDSRKALEHGV